MRTSQKPSADRLPWSDAQLLLREHGAAAGQNALQRLTDFEESSDYGAAVWWGRVYLAIARLTDGERPPGTVMH